MLLPSRMGDARLQAEGSARIVLLVDVVTRNELQRILSSGVRAVLRRDATAGEIFAAIEAAAAGLTTIGPDELDLLFPTGDAALLEDERVLEALSARETEVLALMTRGLGNKNIADRLPISEHTVKFHVISIRAKLGAASRTEAVTRGLKEGLRSSEGRNSLLLTLQGPATPRGRLRGVLCYEIR